ncbi:MAG TPA: hypothetical protein VFH62_06950 [Dehalococcoidia bacterium]|jgi:hypothetical protein|nr:hypothetical protein [Dehalococcoidia bacterium]
MSLLAGAARVSIGPRRDDLRDGVWLGGFGSYRERRASAVHDEPQCRALALSDGTTSMVLAALDLIGASGPLLATIRADASRMTGVAPERILIACTHSHASPDTQGLWGGIGDAYRTHIAHRAASAIWEAHEAMAPAAASAASTQLHRVTKNRRGWPETDDALTSLRLTSPAGAPIATLVNFACHPTSSGSSNTEVSRDWCGYAVDAVERETGGVAIYVNGAIGDANPIDASGFEASERLGEAVAASAIASLDAADAIDGALSARTDVLELPVHFERLSQRVQSAIDRSGFAIAALSKTGSLRATQLALHAAGRRDIAQIVSALEGMSEREKAHRDGRTYVLTQCGYVRIGDALEAYVAPGEVLTRLALPLRAAMGARHRMFFGLTHDTLGYFVPEDEWMTGRNNNYEESVSMGRRAGSVLADALLAMVPHGREA